MPPSHARRPDARAIWPETWEHFKVSHPNPDYDRAVADLFAYHLPLDAHPVVGNNAQLALRMGWLTIEQDEDDGFAAIIAAGPIGDRTLSLGVLCEERSKLLAHRAIGHRAPKL